MTRRRPVEPSLGPLEKYAARFDDLFGARAQRQGFSRYLEGLFRAQRKEAQSLQWFLSESGWDPDAVDERRPEFLLEEALHINYERSQEVAVCSETNYHPQRQTPTFGARSLGDARTALDGTGALVIDETGDRKDGKKTAHVGKQSSSLWVDERPYYPLMVEPYTPAHHFEGGKADPAFRTKPQITLELLEAAFEAGPPFRALVADSFYGEHRGFREALGKVEVP